MTTMMMAMTMTTMTATMTDRSAARGMRHEYKHQISPQDDLVLSQRLRKLFSHDKNAGADGTYRITSLYFDTPDDGALREKLDGIGKREKFRLRYYGAAPSFIRLEKKFKVNGLCGKKSVKMTAEQVQELLCGEYGFLLESGEPLCVEFYSKLKGKCLRPRTIVRYDREAFVYKPGNVRITLDRNIRTGLGSTDFLNGELFCAPVLEQSTVLEVKYDAFLPDLVRMAIQIPNRQAASCSKYALCRRFD